MRRIDYYQILLGNLFDLRKIKLFFRYLLIPGTVYRWNEKQNRLQSVFLRPRYCWRLALVPKRITSDSIPSKQLRG